MQIKPTYSVPEANLVPVVDYPGNMTPIPTSRMFVVKQALKKYKEATGSDVVYDASQGDGGASLTGVPQFILDRAHEMQLQKGTGYATPAGTPEYRKCVIEQYWQLDSATGWGPQNVVATQGGRDALMKAFQSMIRLGYGRVGDALLVSAVPWISYNWGPYAVGLNVLRAPGDEEDGWAYTEESLTEAVAFAEKRGQKVAGIVITSPDNPTGRTITLERQIELAKKALELGVYYVLFDWIYHWVSENPPHNVNEVLLQFTPEERKRLMFLDGITKSLGGSNIRNCHLMADADVCKFITSLSSHGVIVSYYSQAVAMAAYEHGFADVAQTVNVPTNASRRVLQAKINEKGMKSIMGNGYYGFIHIGEWMQAAGFETSETLGFELAEKFGVAVVPGVFFSEAGNDWIRFSYATPPEITAPTFDRLYEGLEALAGR